MANYLSPENANIAKRVKAGSHEEKLATKH